MRVWNQSKRNTKVDEVELINVSSLSKDSIFTYLTCAEDRWILDNDSGFS
jgi:hypothetical protein